MRRMFAAFLMAVFALSAFALPAYGAGTAGGQLEVVLRLDYRESSASFQNRGVTLTLTGTGGGSFSLPLNGNDTEETFPFGGQEAQVRLSYRNPQDAPFEGNDRLGFVVAEFSGLPKEDRYQVSLKGKGFSSFTSQEYPVKDCAPHIYISAESGGFALGDVDGNGTISQEDLDRLFSVYGSDNTPADINLDGKVGLVDLALVHHNMAAKRPEEVYNGALSTDGLLDLGAIAQELAQGGIQITNGASVEDLFLDNGQKVRLTAGEGSLCQIPITFAQPKEMSEITIVSPAVSGAPEEGSLQVEYEDGTMEEIPFDKTPPAGVYATERQLGESTVAIRLGQRVPVKKITITVEKVYGVDGTASYIVVEKIEFLRDIIPENIDLGASIPRNVYAQAGSGSVSLTWRGVDNVDGYLVKYGESQNTLSRQLKVGTPEAVVTGLKNLTTYYFTVSAYSGEWTGSPSAVVSCIPQPSKAPLPPDNLSLTPEDSAIMVSWKKTEDAAFYNLYYKETAKQDFALAAEKITDTSYTVSGLVNDVSYDFYVTAGNQIGFSRPSLTATGKPEKEILNFPTLPTLNRIPNSAIISAELENKNNVSGEYGGKFDPKWTYDGDFETHWTARVWWESSRITFEFDEEKSMDYLIYVPRLNKGFPQSLQRYSIAAWDKDGNMTWLTPDNGTLTNRPEGNVGIAPIVRNDPKTTGFAILPFKRNDHIKKISVLVRQGDGTPQPSSLSEIAFYSYDDIDDSIAALFSDSAYTQIAPTATQARIDELRARLQSADGYYVNKEILLDELDLAEHLLKGDGSTLGRVVDTLQSRNASADPKRISTLQPAGVTAAAGSQVVVYAQIPEGEVVNLVPTQHYAEAAKWRGASQKLENGRNIITIPRINDVSPQKGGSLYLEYAGEKAQEIRLQFRGGTAIPVLELSDWHQLAPDTIKARISYYLKELEQYYSASLSGMNGTTLQTHYLNATEIALPHVLLSLPASQVRAGLGTEDPAEALYQDGLAWEELMTLMYRTHGIDEAGLEASVSRHNIRYMRMFGNAFMYASGSHIGIGFGSCSGMMGGRPTSTTGAENPNGLFGWGIQHEIGHVMDTLGKAEITNNIYSLFAQTRDGGNNALASRLEKSGKYEGIYQKVTSGQVGMSNDVFVSLGMYWQLHLAYDGADDNFYEQINKTYKGGGDDGFMAAASQVSGHNLSDFFQSWGLTPSGQSGTAEERKIQYLTDESRRERMAGTSRQSGTVGITADYDKEARQATVTITPVTDAKMLGYEISRTLNGDVQAVAFLSAASGKTTWTDTLGSVNNKAVTYSVKAVDILGYVIDQDQSRELDIAHDNIISRNSYSWSRDGSVLTASLSGEQPVAGIRFASFPAPGGRVLDSGAGSDGRVLDSGPVPRADGSVTVEVSLDGSTFTTVLEASWQELADSAGTLRFFTRKDHDGSICPFDAKLVRISGLPDEVTAEAIDLAAYPGDSIQFGENGIGILGKDYKDLKAGTLIITGSFRGNPVFNTVRLYGRSQSGSMAKDEITDGDPVPMEGEVYLFAALPKEGDMGEIDNGLWIFVPKQQTEGEAATEDGGNAEACLSSLLPTQIMAELHRTDVPEGGSGRITSNTRWIPSPTYETMPKIILEE
ncbi:MAG: hypothetical protein HFF10_03885 [Angelakisella sp.]|nr:hypothetical protein [Angelakisella sp.]